MPIINVKLMKITNERETVILGVLQWDEVTTKCN